VITRGLIKGNISSDGLIDDDFETELGGHEPIVSEKILKDHSIDLFISGIS
jgi:hypothetical protein